MPMLTDRKPFNNNDVRLALKYAVDREHLLKKIARGYGAAGNDHPIAPCQKCYASELPQRTYDPDQARFHMKKAGMLDFTFSLHAADSPWNDTFWKHERFNMLLKEARAELNDAKRRELYVECKRILKP
jgi:ABC-type transport system substrate-binding protein